MPDWTLSPLPIGCIIIVGGTFVFVWSVLGARRRGCEESQWGKMAAAAGLRAMVGVKRVVDYAVKVRAGHCEVGHVRPVPTPRSPSCAL